MSSTNWKNLGRKQGGNMKNYRNVKSDKNFYNNGKWDTFYTDDDIKRLAYYNIDLPHVVGIGTKIPFSKLSFGDSSNSGDYTNSAGIITPGQVTAIALNERPIVKEIPLNPGIEKKYNGQDFSGFSYVTKLRSIRKDESNDEAKGVGIYANKSNISEDTSLKTDKAVMYVTDDNLVQIGGVPKKYKFVDVRAPPILPGNISSSDGRILTGPNVILDVSGSVHVNGFINFLKNGSQINQQTDNPAGQLTYDPVAMKIKYAQEAHQMDDRACPEGAIWVGWDVQDDALTGNPRLFIQRAGLKTRVLTEFDINIDGDEGGFKWEGANDDNNSGQLAFYVFRNPNERPNNSLINTYIGRPGITNGASPFTNAGTTLDNDLPRLWRGPGSSAADPTPSALSVVGNLSVFDFTTGGRNGEYLDGFNTKLINFKRILESDIYTRTDNTTVGSGTANAEQKELGSIYCDRHIMIGGFKGNININGNAVKFSHFSSAIDISGGILQKPLMRVLTGNNNGSLVNSGVNCQDSIIIGNTDVGKFSDQNKECILVGENTKYENNENTLVMGNNNTVKNTKNSIVIGEGCKVDVSSNVISGLVVMGADTEANQSSDRIVFGTSTKKRAFVIDENGQVTIAGDLKVQGGHVHMETERIVGADEQVDINSKYDENSSSVVGNATYGPNASNGGIQLFLTENNPSDNAQFTFDNFNKRWTTANSSYSIGFAAAANTVGTSGTERFKVTKDGDLVISSDGTSANDKFKVTAQDGHVDMSGNLHIHGTGGITLENGETITNTNDGTVVINGEVAAGLGDSGSSVFKSNGAYDVTLKPGGTNSSNIKIEGTNNTGDITITASKDIVMNATDDIVMDASGDIVMKPTSTTSKMVIYEEYDSANVKGAEFVKNGNAVDLKISGKLDVLGLIDPTGLILSNHNLTSAEINAMDTESLAIYNDGTGKLSFKFKDTNGAMATHELATIGGGQQISGNISNATLANFAHDLSFNSAEFTGKGILYQDTAKDTKIKKYETANTTNFLKADGTYAVPPGTFSLSVATNNSLGGIKVGSGLSITNEFLSASGITNAMLSGSIDDSKLNTITEPGKVSGSAVDLSANQGLMNSNGLGVLVDDSSIEIHSDGNLRVKASGITNAMLGGSIDNSKLNTITTVNKVSGSAVQLRTNPGLEDSSGLGVLVDNTSIEIDTTSGNLRVKASGITSSMITSTLTNKTLNTPEISSIKNGGATLILPTGPGTLALEGSVIHTRVHQHSTIHGISSQFSNTFNATTSILDSLPWWGVASSADGTKLVASSSSPGASTGDVWYSTDSGENWTRPLANAQGVPQAPYTTDDYRGVCSSSDGTVVLVCVNGGNIWRTGDSFSTWVEHTPANTTTNWRDVACNTDGTKVVAVVYGGDIWKKTTNWASPNTNWAKDTSVGGTKNWQSIASSADGTRLAAVEAEDYTLDSSNQPTSSGGGLWTSNDGGSTWTKDTSVNAGADTHWKDITMSEDGTKLMACVYSDYDGKIYIGDWPAGQNQNTPNSWTDSGVLGYSTSNPAAPQPASRWSSIASSADGLKLSAVTGNTPFNSAGLSNGEKWTSSDGGTNWEKDQSIGNNNDWTAVASSSEADRVLGAVNGGAVYTFDRGYLLTLGEVAGRVGIGTTLHALSNNPLGSKLEIAASSKYDNGWYKNLKLQAAEATTKMMIESSNVALGFNDSNKAFYFMTNTVAGTDDFRGSAPASSVKMIIKDGKVGIGTNSPTKKLQVAGDVVLGYIAGTNDGLWMSNSQSSGVYAHSPFIQGVTSAFAPKRIALNPNGGNVGIGTNSPGISLDVHGSYLGRYYNLGGVHDEDKRDSFYIGRWDGTGFSDGFLGMEFKVDTYGNMGYGGYNNQTAIIFHSWGNNYASSREVMRIRGDGNVGIGTNSPSAKLDVAGDIKFTGTLYQNGSASWYSGSGATIVEINHTTGHVGIGTNSPGFPLEVNNHTLSAIGDRAFYSMAGNYGAPTLHTGTRTSGNADVCIKANDDVWCVGAFISSSDERIKENIIEVPDNLALQMLRDIDCKYYEYKDKISKGTQQTIGFIAQQVKEHLPIAVSVEKSIIPNEMRVLETTWDELNMSSDLTDVSGVKYRFYVSNDPSGNDEVEKEIIGNADNTFTFDKQYNNVFCYGKQVDDFHTVDKQKIFAVNFSATQEIDKIQQEEKTKLAAAEERITALETENATLKAQLNSIEARLAALEA